MRGKLTTIDNIWCVYVWLCVFGGFLVGWIACSLPFHTLEGNAGVKGVVWGAHYLGGCLRCSIARSFLWFRLLRCLWLWLCGYDTLESNAEKEKGTVWGVAGDVPSHARRPLRGWSTEAIICFLCHQRDVSWVPGLPKMWCTWQPSSYLTVAALPLYCVNSWTNFPTIQ